MKSSTASGSATPALYFGHKLFDVETSTSYYSRMTITESIHDHDRDLVVRALYAGMSGGGLRSMIDLLDPHVVLHVPGDHPLAGDHTGVAAVADFIRATGALTTGGTGMELLDVLHGERYAAAYVRVAAERCDRAPLDTHNIHLLDVDDGRIREIWFHNGDQSVVDAFWGPEPAASFRIQRTIDIDRPAAQVWAVVADYERDPEWRAGVVTMAPSQHGVAGVGTTTAEELHIAGLVLHNRGVVTSVDPGVAFTWRTTEGAEAHGSRRVEPLGPAACRLVMTTWVTMRGELAAMAGAFEALLGDTMDGDLDRLRTLLEA
jgi:ketosteroid isomerase-like protein